MAEDRLGKEIYSLSMVREREGKREREEGTEEGGRIIYQKTNERDRDDRER